MTLGRQHLNGQQWLGHAADLDIEYLSAANVLIFPESHELIIAGESVHCSRKQFRFLLLLISNFCRTVTRERLLDAKKMPLRRREQNLLKVQMFHLRRLLKQHGAQLEIRNVPGRGYQARPQV